VVKLKLNLLRWRTHIRTSTEAERKFILVNIATMVELTTSQSPGETSAIAIALYVSLESQLVILKASPFMKFLSRYIIY